MVVQKRMPLNQAMTCQSLKERYFYAKPDNATSNRTCKQMRRGDQIRIPTVTIQNNIAC